jgi:putative ABC transport system permease protein
VTPPRLAWLALHLLPRALREPIAGDLEEEWRAGAHRSRWRLWNLVLRSIAACWLDRLRHGAGRRDTPRPKGDSAMQSLRQDLHYGWRLMWRNPGFTFATVATLALGIGANTAIFSVVNVLSWKALPYHEPDRVAFVLGWDLEENEMRFNLRQADYLDLQRSATTLAAVSAYSYVSANLTGGDMPDRVQAYRVTPSTFPLLGVPAALGRVFDHADAAAGRGDVAVMSHGLWQRRFGGDAAIIGRRIDVNGQPHEVIGVMPPRFDYPVFNFKGDLWLPWDLRDAERGQPGARGGATVVGRLRPGVSYAAAQAEVDVLMRGFADRYPDSNRGLGARIVEMGRLDDEQAGAAPWILLAAVGAVLLLACANVGNLLLARGIVRHRELALRAAIGASRLRIGRQLIVEGVLLGLAGGLSGLLVAVLALAGLRASLPEVLLATMPNINELGIDGAALGFTLAVSLLASLAFGALPAWRASRELFEGALKESGSAGGSRGTRRLRAALVVSEVALATILLVTAGLLGRSYAGLQRISPGFDPSHVMTITLSLPEYKYDDAGSRLRFYEDLAARVSALPGVTATALVNVLPFSTYDRSARLTIEGAPPAQPGREPSVGLRVATARYPETLRIPLVAGRFFERRDAAGGEPVAVVNQAAAARHFGGQDPLGRRIRLGNAEQPWLTIVGVIGNVHHSTLTEAPQPEVYVALAQSPGAMMMLAARTAGRPEDATAALRGAVQAIDKAQPVYHVRSLESLVGDALLPSRTAAGFTVLFGALALVLATIGIYGVMAYSVSQQTREFGVRLALGATPRDLLRQVLQGGVVMVGAGVAIGMAGGVAVARLLSGTLYGIGPDDPATYAGVLGVLALSALAACAVPAWRASTTAAADALRAE